MSWWSTPTIISILIAVAFLRLEEMNIPLNSSMNLSTAADSSFDKLMLNLFLLRGSFDLGRPAIASPTGFPDTSIGKPDGL